MKLMIQKTTGMDETSVIEFEGANPLAIKPEEVVAAYEMLDARLRVTNDRIARVRNFVNDIKDPNYRYLFTAFFDQCLGVGNETQSLLKRYGVERPDGYDEWEAKGKK